MTEDETQQEFDRFRERLESMTLPEPRCPACGGTFESCTCTGVAP